MLLLIFQIMQKSTQAAKPPQPLWKKGSVIILEVWRIITTQMQKIKHSSTLSHIETEAKSDQFTCLWSKEIHTKSKI